MITSPLAAEEIAANRDPANYWDMPAGGLLHERQVRFLAEVERDPRELGFEGDPDEVARLQVAAVYLQEEQSAAHHEPVANLYWYGKPLEPGSLAPSTVTPYEAGLIRTTKQTLASRSDTSSVVQEMYKRHEGLDKQGAILAAELWYRYEASSYSPADRAAYLAIGQVLGEYESRMYQPVVSRLHGRATTISPEQVQWEIEHGTLSPTRSHGVLGEQEHSRFAQDLSTGAQRSFRIANTTTMSIEALTAAMDLPPSEAGDCIRSLIEAGKLRRNPAGNMITATEFLNVEQGRLARTASMIGYRLLHYTYMLRLPQLERA